MTRGKQTCKILKDIRQEIADKNEIAYTPSECHFEGECQGTCPKCEAELKYIENELHKRKILGKTATIAGISLGIASTFSACNFPSNSIKNDKTEITDTVPVDASSVRLIWQTLNSEGMVFESRDTSITNNAEYVWRYVDVYPEYPNGNKIALPIFIHKNAKYPQEAKENNWEGDVDVAFIVEKDGSLTNIRIRRSSGHSILDEEALRLVKSMPKWKPAQKNGKNVRTKFRIPVNFRLEENK